MSIRDRLPRRANVRWVLALTALALAVSGCRQDMHDQPRYEVLEASDFFDDGGAARPIPAGTVARGNLRADRALYEGKDEAGEFIEGLPVELDRELLYRGQTRYEIFCSPCHDSTGSGRGMIVRRGYKQPPAFYEDRLLAMPAGYFYDVITNGYGLMSSYARQVPVEDRWAIVAYVRALQLSQRRPLNELDAELRQEFQHAIALPAAEGDGHHGESH